MSYNLKKIYIWNDSIFLLIFSFMGSENWKNQKISNILRKRLIDSLSVLFLNKKNKTKFFCLNNKIKNKKKLHKNKIKAIQLN